MKICIVRHGSAVIGSMDDQHRELTEKGRFQAQAAGEWMAEQEWNDPVLWVSPYYRTQQTASLIAESLPLDMEEHAFLVPSSDVNTVVDELLSQERDIILVSHLPLVGRLAAYLVEGQVFDQPWSPAECWLLSGDVAGPGCLSVESVWYPVLSGL
ncbi:phosphohistidine phosphatase SixA [Oceanobacter sp. 4_MG-2023]|uniref:phosphohistidine phosphatase SixA n=1 Tax=Oceanobacter sp. 4_MG-2023 TaxID=3062623 RepID=UPI00273538DC|nr:phosphohistidine phosphatase SixA [Oceanobacter sp. 4_MG-2023]MDP2546743.1 phosphohistidine phosphatase SixA [Oceanobacter sp. 4_MG-2023]